jgi:Cu(I)/Ag(I) efflux system membrane fusion protein
MAVAEATRLRWLGWLVALAVIVAAGIGLWYAHAYGWLDPAYAWVRHLTHKDYLGTSGHGGMDMNMPGMDMGQSGKPSKVPGHAEVTIPGEVQQRIGVTVGKVEETPLRMSVRTVGIVETDETKVDHIHLKTEGWVEKVFVGYTGQKVKKGDPLLAIYSPQFLTTQQDFLNARQAKQPTLVELARRRLELWDVPADEIKELESNGKPSTYLTLRSPLTGTVLVKNAFAGQYVTPEKELYVLADLSTVWVQAKAYEYELPHVEKDQPASVTVPALPEKQLTGKVVFLQPTVDPRTRTVQVRVELPNKEGLLRPGMFAHVTIEHSMGTGLLVLASAVIRTGERDVAYLVKSGGRFVPVEVKISPFRFDAVKGAGGRFQVLEGLKAGDRVVTSANFLIDSESRLRLGGGMMNMPSMEMGDMKNLDSPTPKDMDHSKMKH